MGVLNWLRAKLNQRAEDKLLHEFGGIQWCPWCRQCAQSKPGWHFKMWEENGFFDVLTCGVCGGTSLWHFAIGMIFVRSLEPPKPAFPDNNFGLPLARSAAPSKEST